MQGHHSQAAKFENYLLQKYFCKTIRNASFSRHLKCKLWRICSIYFWNKTWFYLVRKIRFLLFCFRSMIKHKNYFRSALRKVSSKYIVHWSCLLPHHLWSCSAASNDPCKHYHPSTAKYWSERGCADVPLFSLDSSLIIEPIWNLSNPAAL